MSANSHLHDQIKKLFLEKLNLEVPSIDTDLIAAGFLDSLQFVQLLLHIEQEFGIQISVENIQTDDFLSIARISEYVSNHK